jgi:hypothetical protein
MSSDRRGSERWRATALSRGRSWVSAAPHSADDRDVARALRRALKRAGRREGDPRAVQVAGEALEADDYARWRERKLRRGALTWAPELGPGRYALVLYAIEPSTTEQFVRHGAGRHVMPPTVGDFKAAIEPAVALAGTLGVVARDVRAAGRAGAAAAPHGRALAGGGAWL